MLKLAPAGSSHDDLSRSAQQLSEDFDLRLTVQRNRLLMQDAWLLMYLLIDITQNEGPMNREKYYSPRAANIVDTARRVLSRNPVKYHIVGRHFAADMGDQQKGVRTLENVLHGLMFDIDRQLRARGEMNARQQTAFHALVRGAWSYKLHLSKNAKTSTGSPAMYEQIDPRLVLPHFDRVDIEDAISYNITTLLQMRAAFPEKLDPVVKYLEGQQSFRGRTIDYGFLHQPLRLIEYSSREQQALLLDLGGLAEMRGVPFTRMAEERRYMWLDEPYDHGFGRSLIQYGNVNGMPAGLASREAANLFPQSPLLKLPIHRGGSTTTGFSTWSPTVYLSSGPGQLTPAAGMVDPGASLAGRAIYANVAHLLPELNRLFALLKQAVVQEVRGTWTFRSRNAGMPALTLGDGSINPIRLEEALERVRAEIQSADALSMAQLISQEISEGTIDLRFILAAEMEGSGTLRARLEQANMLGVDDYKQGVADWAVSVADTFQTQYRAAKAGAFKDWQLVGRQASESSRFFVVDIDEQVDKLMHEGKEPPIIEATVRVAMPVDLAARINMAKMSIDPQNPIMSLRMALDLIMEFDDPEAAEDMILQDVGNRNPTIQLVKIAQAFIDNGAPELAQMIMQDSFRSAFANEVGSHGGATQTPSGASPGIGSGTAAPEQTSGGGTEPTGPSAPVAAAG